MEKAGIGARGPGALSIDALTVAAWSLRPDIAVAAADVATGNAAERVAVELPNPTLSIDPGYLYDNVNHNVSPWTIAAAVGFTIETAGKREIRVAQARADTEARRWQFAETLWRAREDVRKAVLARQLAEAALALAEQEAGLRRSFTQWVDAEFRFGAVAQPDRLAAQTALTQAEIQFRSAGGDLAAADAALASSVGLAAENLPLAGIPPVAIDELPDPATLEPATLRRWGLVDRLSISHALADYAVTEQDLRMAVAKQYPDIAFGPGYSFDKGDKGVTLSLGFTLPLFHGEGAAIDQAIAARRKAATTFEAAQADALAQVDTALARYRAAFPALATARDGEAAAGRAAKAAERRLNMGDADRGEFLTAQIAWVESRRAALDAHLASFDALIALEDAIQRPVWPQSRLTVQRPDSKPAE